MMGQITETVSRLTCCARVWPAGAMRFQRCGVTAKYEHNGEHYCKTHHPPSVQAKREARHAHNKAEFEERQSASNAAQSAADAQRKNAERYLWLRDSATIGTVHIHTLAVGGWSYYGIGADEVVDAAMAAQKEPT